MNTAIDKFMVQLIFYFHNDVYLPLVNIYSMAGGRLVNTFSKFNNNLS